MTHEPDARAFSQEEYRALKQEMLLRIAIQNLAILGAVAVFTTTAILGTIVPTQAGMLALVQSLASLALTLQWSHNGIRQGALRQAILDRDERAGRKSEGWEGWLPTARPARLLGSLWFVSTKAVFIGLTAVSILIAVQDRGLAFWCAVASLIVMTVALLADRRE